MNSNILIKTVSPCDAEELLNIYAYYVENTAITFEYDVPSVSEFNERIVNTLKKYPYIAAVSDGEILGYAYTGAFKSRAAYDRSVETSIYVKNGSRGLGIGRMLYSRLEEISKSQNVLNMYACISYTEKEDEYLTNASPLFHKRHGYKTVGKFRKCGYKFGRWYDMIWMGKFIGRHTPVPKPFVPFELLRRNGNNK